MGGDAAFDANPQLCKAGDSGVRPLDNPAVPTETVIALDALACDSHLDATPAQMRSAASAVIALVSMQLVRPAAWSAREASH